MLTIFLWFSFTFHLSHSHVRLVCPQPLNVKSDITLTTKAQNSDSNIHEKCLSTASSSVRDVIEIHPGLFTIRFEETKFLPGTPFRILLIGKSSSYEEIHEHENIVSRFQRDTNIIEPNENDFNVSDSQFQNKSDHIFLIESNTTDTRTPELDFFVNTLKNDSTSENDTTATTTDSPDDIENKQSQKDKNMHKVTTDMQSCLLLDHIPHNDHAVINKGCLKEFKTIEEPYPLGSCTESTYYITLLLPDVNCLDCLLVVQQVETNPDHSVCDLNSEDQSSECTSYISCARVNLRPTKDGLDRNLSHCSNYQENLSGYWPYRAQDLYMTEENAVLTMDLRHRDLHIEVPEESTVGRVEIVEVWLNSTVIWKTSAYTTDGQKSSKITHFMWRNIPTKFLEKFKANQLKLNVIGNKQSKASDIVFKDQHFEEGHMTTLYDTYSPNGWLIGPKFLGTLAEDSVAAIPVGDCAPVARYFMAFFESVEGGNHGLLGITILENRAYITSVIHVRLGHVLFIKMVGSDLTGAKSVEIPVPAVFNGVIQTAIDITQQIKYMDTVQFFKSVEVKTDRDDAAMIGDLEEGFYSVLRDSQGKVKGMGAFQLTQGHWMKVQIVTCGKQFLNHDDTNQNTEDTDTDLIPEKTTAEIISSYSQLLDLSKEAVYCYDQFCCLEAYVHELTSDLLLYLLIGKATLRVLGEESSISGPITGPSCSGHYAEFCQMSKNLSRNEYYSTVFGPKAQAIVHLDRAQVLELSIRADVNKEFMSSGFSAKLIVNNNPELSMPLTFFKTFDHAYIAKGQYPLSKSTLLRKHLFEPQSVTYLKVTSQKETMIDGKLPPFEKRKCISNKIHVLGKGKSYWSPKSAPFDDLHAVVSDNIKFVFDNTTSLYLLESLESYKKCDFSKAKQLEVLNNVKGMGLHFFALKKEGSYYFADQNSCLSNDSAKVAVHVIQARDNIVKDGARGKWCRVSHYKSWRQKKLDQWEGPSSSGTIALGLGLGFLVGFIFLLWQGIRMKHSPSQGGVGRRSSLTHFVRF